MDEAALRVCRTDRAELVLEPQVFGGFKVGLRAGEGADPIRVHGAGHQARLPEQVLAHLAVGPAGQPPSAEHAGDENRCQEDRPPAEAPSGFIDGPRGVHAGIRSNACVVTAKAPPIRASFATGVARLSSPPGGRAIHAVGDRSAIQVIRNRLMGVRPTRLSTRSQNKRRGNGPRKGRGLLTTVYCGSRQKSSAAKERDRSGEAVYPIQTLSSAPGDVRAGHRAVPARPGLLGGRGRPKAASPGVQERSPVAPAKASGHPEGAGTPAVTGP